MLKPLLLLAVTANIFFVATVKADEGGNMVSSSAIAHASSYTGPECNHEDNSKKCNGPNEIFLMCPSQCPPQRCDVDIATILCPVPPQPGDPTCQPGCHCITGYVRNAAGICIPRDQCGPKCGKHEVFSDCINGGCDARNCSQLGYPIPCVKPKICIKGCVCEKDYFKDDNGVCIHRSKCPSPCGKNEILHNCIEGFCDAKTCNDLGYPVACPDVKQCTKGCLCDVGHVRNSEGICIPKSECPSCGGDSNAQSGCGARCRRCSNNNKGPVPCPLICMINGCDCKNGYVHDDITGKCVLPKNCSPVCGANEVYKKCITKGCIEKNKCSGLGRNIVCEEDKNNCNPGCLCKDGFRKNSNGVCIPKDKCPSCGGDPNAKAGCGTHCNRRCSDLGKEPKFCTLQCKEDGCDCKNGHILDDITGKCVKPENCSSCGGDPNAQFGCGDNCGKLCSDFGKKNSKCLKTCKVKGCNCRPGYYFDKIIGKCVLPEECTNICPKNEVYISCVEAHCKPKNCSQLGFPIMCPKVNKRHCTGGCLCKDDYARAPNGTCIPIKQCPSCGGDPNAQSGCGARCRRCSNYNKGPVPCPLKCMINGCDCKNGYVHDDITGKCVLPKNCSPVCGANEVYKKCITKGCVEKNKCSGLGRNIVCEEDKNNCNPGCLCKDGFRKNSNGVCIPKDKCPSCGGDPNAKAGCGTHCNRRCSDLGKEPKFCTLQCKEDGCDCKNGHILDDITGKCVKPENCSCPNPNEVIDLCPRSCPPRTCESLDRMYICPIKDDDSKRPCKPACRCKEGYYININGQCNTESECRQCNGPHEYFNCGVACDNVCATLSEMNQTHCPLINIKCNPKCYCAKDYARSMYNDTCIPISKCNETLCPINEEFSNCANGGCEKRNCSQLIQPDHCIKVAKCIKGCVCKKGHLRNEEGFCVPISKCPSPCGKNEILHNCIEGFCDAKTCNELGYPVACPDVKQCTKGCLCDVGHVRNIKGICIPKSKCPSCGGDPNAQSGCGARCRRCSNYNKGPVPCPLKCMINGCDCKNGYVHDDITGKCVLPKNCSPVCGANEVYKKCITKGCVEKNKCSGLGRNIICEEDKNNCNPGCLCKDGFRKNSNGVCIPKDKCPSCGGDPNAKAGCGTHCNRRCSDLGKEPKFCTLQCKEDGCDCKNGHILDDITGKCVKPENCSSCGGDPNAQFGCGDNCGKLCSDVGKNNSKCLNTCKVKGCNCRPGYYFDKIIGKCVLPEECTPICGKHEVVSNCANGGCDKRNCTQLDQPTLCIDPIKCKKGCVCKPGFLKNHNNVCVPVNDCPKICPKNEVFNSCVEAHCTPKNCSQVGFPIKCPKVNEMHCTGGCLCKVDYVRGHNRMCIPIKQCPSCGGDPNAQSGCGARCRRCSNYNKGHVPCPIICMINGCDCKNGYVHDDVTGKCVLPKNCSPVCGANEVYKKCITKGCVEKNKCSGLGRNIVCEEDKNNCTQGCLCKDGFRKNSNGVCIPKDKCPSCGGDPNAKAGCGTHCNRRCSDLGKEPKFCTLQCKEDGCDCKNGHILDDITGKCVKPENCSSPCGKNEILHNCIEGFCDAKTCNELGYPVACPDVKQCTKGCLCDVGHVRNSEGICIPKSECPSCGGDPNAQFGCGDNCGKLCSDVGKKNSKCLKICKVNGCNCRPGYYFDKIIGKCVLPEECTPICGKNEVVSNCANGGCDKRNCTQLDQPTLCIDPIKCKKGCVCKPGFLRNHNNVCVPIKDCPLVCRDDEYYTNCIQGQCLAQNCSQLGYPIPCPRIDPRFCIKGCLCKGNKIRAQDGTCIPKKHCPSCGGDPNAVAGCGFNTNKLCSDVGKKTKPFNDRCEPYVNSCDCRDGFYKDPNTKKCVRPNECTRECNLPHEVYKPCAFACPEQSCSSIGEKKICNRPPAPGDSKCKGACRCENNYCRNIKGECISIANSLKCNGPHEYFSCGSCCDNECKNLKTQDKYNCPIKSEKCMERCYCEDDYARNSENICVPIKDCKRDPDVTGSKKKLLDFTHRIFKGLGFGG